MAGVEVLSLPSEHWPELTEGVLTVPGLSLRLQRSWPEAKLQRLPKEQLGCVWGRAQRTVVRQSAAERGSGCEVGPHLLQRK